MHTIRRCRAIWDLSAVRPGLPASGKTLELINRVYVLNIKNLNKLQASQILNRKFGEGELMTEAQHQMAPNIGTATSERNILN